MEDAVKKATGVGARTDGPPCFAFSLHLRASPGLVEHTPVAVGSVVQIELSELVGLRAGLDQLKAISRTFPRCATFALGGLPVISYLAELQSSFDTSTEEGQEARLAALRVSQAKFHVHEGLLWEVESPTPEARFHQWLATLPLDEPLMIVDTTFSGGGINKIINSVLAASPRPMAVEIHGLLDSSRTPVAPGPRTESDARGTVRAVLHGVPSLITEDAAELVGYDSIRRAGGLRSRWDSATVEVVDGRDVLTVIGTSGLAGTVSDLIRQFNGGAPLDADFRAASAYLSVMTQLGNELRNVRQELERGHASGLLSSSELVHEFDAAAKRFSGLKATARRKLAGQK